MITPEIKNYIEKNKLCTEYLFADWEAFLDLLYSQNSCIEAVLWFEYVRICEQKESLGSGGYKDKTDPEYMYAETELYEDGFQHKTLEEVKEYIRSVIDEHPGKELMPAFYIYDENGTDLRKYDDKCVRITCTDGNIYDGIAMHNSADYNEHEFGRYEDGLQLTCFLFYKSDIGSIEILEDNGGPYGSFIDPYGRLEEEAVKDGADLIDEILFCEEKEHVLRMLRCLDKYLDPEKEYDFPQKDEVPDMLKKLARETQDDEIREAALSLIYKKCL